MGQISTDIEVRVPVERAWSFYADVRNLTRVIPAEFNPQLVKLFERFEPGAEFILRVAVGYWMIQWHGRIVEVDAPHRFTAEQIDGPFTDFSHEVRFDALEEVRTRVTETTRYELPYRSFGRLADSFLLRRKVRSMLDRRQEKIRRLLEGA